jgi:hypothetical protein
MSSQKTNQAHDPAQGLASLTAELVSCQVSVPCSDVLRLLKSGRYSNLTIKCGAKIFKVHRNVVAVQSKPLAAAVDGDFKV